MTAGELATWVCYYLEKYPELENVEVEVYDVLGADRGISEVTCDGNLQICLNDDAEFWNPNVHNEPEEPSKN
jgi:hypothetical protein